MLLNIVHIFFLLVFFFLGLGCFFFFFWRVLFLHEGFGRLGYRLTFLFYIFLFLYFCSVAWCPFIYSTFVWLCSFTPYFGLVDGVSLSFIILTTFIIPIAAFAGAEAQLPHLYFWILFMIEFFLILFFCTFHLLVFYISFEIITILMFLLLLIWGYEGRRILASYYFFYFTFTASFFFLLGLLILYYYTGSFNWYYLRTLSLDINLQYCLWFCFFFAFAVKIPMYPFHIWLPEAHVEAPTGGSILLAGILLKLGYYGFFRISLQLFGYIAQYLLPLLYTLAIFSMLHSMVVSLRQIDAKRIVAYSSIAHMNFAMLGLFSWTEDGILGSFMLMLGHGLISSGLFFLIGILYRQFGTRALFYYSDLSTHMPVFSFFFFLFFLFNVSFPLTFNFTAEILIFLSISTKSKLAFLFSIIPLILNLVNSLLLYVRICHGNSRKNVKGYTDLLYPEFIVLVLLSALCFFFGVAPQFIFAQLV